MREFGAGVRTLIDGFRWWRRAPGTMALGLIPAGIVALVMGAGILVLLFFLPRIAVGLTPFADGWEPFWSGAIRVLVAVAVAAGAVAMVAVTFTAITLVVGEPFYDRIWRTVEAGTTGAVPGSGYGFWRAVGDAAALILRGVLAAVVAGLIGFLPLVGPLAGVIAAAVLSGWLLSDELTSRALTARGYTGAQRRALRRPHRVRALGFGIATHVCFLIPFGAILVMPAAVAGSTLLAQRMAGPAR